MKAPKSCCEITGIVVLPPRKDRNVVTSKKKVAPHVDNRCTLAD